MPKKTTEAIIDSNNNYVIGVKKNQPKLYHQLSATLADPARRSSSFITLEHNRGRIEWRQIMVSDCREGISQEWKGLRQLVGVHRIVKEKGILREEVAYFISSKNGNAFMYEEGIRSHWQIENSLHWVKDVTFKEDASSIKKGNAPQNISTIKNIGMNILRANKYTNMAQAIRLVANDVPLLYNMII